ncbi:MAG TPA: molybdenum cofactor guanylyltransferase [Spirochaetia bacterium]|nr:molybdenum cofactor guanylyltransferase [Spirochaetia bacterium]
MSRKRSSSKLSPGRNAAGNTPAGKLRVRTSAIILAGGQGTRFNSRDKALIDFGGISLLDRRLALLSPLCSAIIVVTNDPSGYGPGNYRIVRDVETGVGPLMGLYTGLASSRTVFNFVTACDMPFLNERLFLLMRDYSLYFDAVIPRMGPFTEPLFAFYSRGCLGAIEKTLEKRERRINSFFNLVRIRYVDEPELRSCDPELASFININTETDLKDALGRMPRRGERLSP